MDRLREWQQEALDRFIGMGYPSRYLVHATPGAGKTVLAAAVAQKLRDANMIDLVVILTPTQNIRENWKNVMHGVGFDICTEPSQLRHDEFDGVAICYQLLAGGSAEALMLERYIAGKRVLFVVDEIHHAAEGGPNGEGNTWGDAVVRLLSRASGDFMLGLTGTPWREPGQGHLPFVNYQEESDGVFVAVPDFSYGYGRAIKDMVCRVIEFRFYRNTGVSVEGDGLAFTEMDERLSEAEARGLYRQALHQKDSPFLREMIQDAEMELRQKQEEVPEAAALYVADDIMAANQAARLIRDITGDEPVVVHSEDPKAAQKLAAFGGGKGRWLVAVQMVSEGVDIPRLAVVVYATTDATELRFRQIVGRAVRCAGPSDPLIATVFLGRLHPLVDHAQLIEDEKHHTFVESLQEALKAVRELRAEIAGARPESSLRIVDAEADGTMFRGAWETEKVDQVRQLLAAVLPDRLAREKAHEITQVFRASGEPISPVPAPARSPIPKQDMKKVQRDSIKDKVGKLMARRGTLNSDGFQSYYASLIRKYGVPVGKMSLEQLCDAVQHVEADLTAERRERGIR